MVTQPIQIVHYLPGRVRVRLSALKGNASLANEVEQTLTALPGVRYVETSATTGSVLVLYEPHLLASLDSAAVGSLMGLARTLGLSFEEMDMDECKRWLQATMHETYAEASTPPGSGIAALFGSVNAGTTRGIGGWGELRTLVPLTLAFLSLRSLLFTPQLPFPTWYDYLWFAFSSYMVLNPPERQGSPASAS